MKPRHTGSLVRCILVPLGVHIDVNALPPLTSAYRDALFRLLRGRLRSFRRDVDGTSMSSARSMEQRPVQICTNRTAPTTVHNMLKALGRRPTCAHHTSELVDCAVRGHRRQHFETNGVRTALIHELTIRRRSICSQVQTQGVVLLALRYQDGDRDIEVVYKLGLRLATQRCRHRYKQPQDRSPHPYDAVVAVGQRNVLTGHPKQRCRCTNTNVTEARATLCSQRQHAIHHQRVTTLMLCVWGGGRAGT